MKNARTTQEIGKLIKYHRKKSGLTQAELAKHCEVSQVSISNLENGIGTNLSNLVKAMHALGLELSFQKVESIDTDNLLGMLE